MWFAGAVKAGTSNDYDGAGVNHLAFHTASVAEVDAAAAYLSERGVAMLFETPRHRPEFSGQGSTYYQIMFESPDRMLFEIAYLGPYAG
jgi:catechol 2,3-dioxygenase-like lactoylglutathione lyase family enzyme